MIYCYCSSPPPPPSIPFSTTGGSLYLWFGCVSDRVVELLTQVLWLLKFLEKKSWCSRLHVQSATDLFSQNLVYLLVHLMRQSLIYK